MSNWVNNTEFKYFSEYAQSGSTLRKLLARADILPETVRGQTESPDLVAVIH